MPRGSHYPKLQLKINISSPQNMKTDLITRGMFLGITAGLIATFFDGLFMLTSDIYIPYSYPVLLLIFNVLFWSIFGSISGILLSLFVSGKTDFHWCFFFLLPFALTYGFLGRLFMPVFYSFETHGAVAVFYFDVSFILGICFFAFIICSLRTFNRNWNSPKGLFTFEITAVILLFQFCSNILKINPIDKTVDLISLSFLALSKSHILVSLYVIGIILICELYLVSLLFRRTFYRWFAQNRYYQKIGLLSILVTIALAFSFEWNQKSNSTGDLYSFNSKANHKKIPQVILIVLDTVRSDCISPCGHHHRTPNLEAFARDAVVFENCIAPSPWTIPSHATIVTGLYPTEHGCHGNIDAQKSDFLGAPLPNTLSDKHTTLQECFRENGYNTAAIISNPGVSQILGFNQGFQFYDARMNVGHIYQSYPFKPLLHIFSYLTNIFPKFTLFYRTADDITRESIKILEGLSSVPFFLFINYMDAHEPYRPPRPFNGHYLNSAFPHLYGLKQYLRFVNTQYYKNHRGSYQFNQWVLYQFSQYKGAVEYLDSQLGNLFAHLKKLGIYETSLIIITSDHGEFFGEHGYYTHRKPMYEEEVKVPLLIKYPFKQRIGLVKERVTLKNLYQTILSLCQMPIPDYLVKETLERSSSSIISELYDFNFKTQRNIYSRNYKYMYYKEGKTPELYDLDKDPQEMNNLAISQKAIKTQMECSLKAVVNRLRPYYKTEQGGDEEIKDTKDKLKALGYIQ